MKYLRVFNKSNTTSSTSGTGTANSSGAPELTFGFNGVLVARSLILYIMLGRLLFVVLYLFLLLCYSSSFFDIRIRIPSLVSSRSSSVCCKYNPGLSAFMAYHLVCNKNNIMVDISGTGTAYSSGAHVFIPSFNGFL